MQYVNRFIALINKTVKKVKNRFKAKDTKVLVSNFSYLTVIELSNYILPFVAIPYIVRVVGVEKYGVIMFAYAFMIYFNLITNFGFRLLAVKYISLNRDDAAKVSSYFSTVLSSQLLLLLLSVFIFLLLLFSVPMFYEEKTVFLYSFGVVIGNVVFPIWLFQGLEDMKYISIFNLINRLLYTVAIFTFIHEVEDYSLIPLINSLSFISIGLVSLYFIHSKFNVYLVRPSFQEMKSLFIEGWHLFLATIANNLYTSTNTVLLGFLTNYTVVGIFSIASKVSGAITKIIKIYSVVVYPYIAKYAENKEMLISKARKLLKLYIAVLAVVGIGTFFSAELLISLLFGSGKESSVLVLKILALTIIVEPLGSFFTSYLVIKNQNKTVSKITFFTMLVNFIFVVPLILLFEAVGMAMTKLIVESFQVAMNIKHNKELVSDTKKGTDR